MKTMSSTAKWISGLIGLSIFFGGIIVSMASFSSKETKIDVYRHEIQINTLSVQQAVIETKLDNIQDDVKEIKELVKQP